MVVFASLIGVAAIFAGAASAVPMDYSPPSSGNYGSYSPPSSGYSNGYGNSDKGSGSYNYNSDSSSSSSTPWPMTTSTAAPASTPTYSTPSYGSGWSSGGDYNNCVQQCMSQYGSPGSMDMPPPSTSTGSGNGATHTVIVAPTQGVLRYVPFALNASVGDTVMFMWGANNHTVTKSSQIEVCNKTSDSPFATGEQNKGFMFSQVVNDTNPTFYYCGTPTHCEKGMFGIINPPNAYQQPGSLSNMMPSLASQYPSTKASWMYSSNFTANNSAAANWGNNIDMSQMPNWTHSYIAENAMYSRVFLASNPMTISTNGAVDLSSLSSNTTVVPVDFAAAARLNNDGSPSYSSPSSSGASPSPSPSSSASGALKNGAGALASPRIVVALVAVAAAAFAL